MKKNAKSVTGGGGFLAFVIFAYFTIPANLNAVELRTICTTDTACQIKDTYPLITNHGIFTLKGEVNYEEGIYIQAIIPSFINYGEIITYEKDQSKPGVFSFSIQDNQTITNLTNYGTISGGISFSNTNDNKTMTITNYGTMGGVSASSANVTIDNFGIFNLVNYGRNGNSNNKKAHFHSLNLTIRNYAMNIGENQTTFNGFDGNATDGDNSHLVLNSIKSVSFADKDSKIILDFGGDFELGKGYLLSKLVVDTDGKNALQVDLSRLTTRSDIYNLTQDGNNFVVNLKPESSTIGSLYKSNVRAMNNFDLISNTMIFPYKYGTKRTTNKRRVMRKAESSQSLESTNKALESLESLESNAFFAYKNDNSTNRTRRRITTNRSTKNATQSTQSTQTASQNDKYYFLLTPFVSHNYFFESGRYNLSGLEYGFITAFGGKITPNNYLGTHFMMSYGSLGDAKDKNFSITNLNLNAGLHYKFEMIWDMYIKARGDFYYFLNQAKTLFIPNAIKPNNLGFGVGVAYGKNFNFGDGGDLGVEVGIDYKGLQTTRITIDSVDKTTSETYQKSLYNLIYADLGVNYAKYFGGFGIDFGVGIKGNVTANKLAKSQIQINQLNRSVDMILDNDNFLGYANLSGSYVLNAKNFDMEFSLAYYGNFGDRIISNGGGFEWRVFW